MASPTQLNVVITQNAGGGSGGTVTTSTVVVPISAGLQALDSTAQGVVQQGYSSVDQAIRNIFRAHGFTDNAGTWYPISVIQKITAQ